MADATHCRLCRARQPLRRSHVLPEFLYRPVYEADNRCWLLDGEFGKRQRVQQGYRERLLCDSCEGIFQKDERYFALLWYQQDPLPDPVHSSVITRSNFSFDRFYRFHLSILWRASVARGLMFSSVDLGPFEESLRQFLVGAIVTPPHAPAVYGMVLRRPVTHELWGRMIVAPTASRLNGIRTYTFIFGGCSWYYCISKRGTPFPESLRLQQPGNLTMPVINYTEEASISRAWKAWQRSRSAGDGGF